MSEPRFEPHQLGDALQKAAELQEGRADAGAADRIGLRGIQQLAERAGQAGTEPPAAAHASLSARLRRTIARLLTGASGR